MHLRSSQTWSWLRPLITMVCVSGLSIAAAQTNEPNAPMSKHGDESVATRSDAPDVQARESKKDKKEDKAPPRDADKPSYFLASQVDWIPLLAPPPDANSPEQQRDLQTVLEVQANNRKGSARRELAIADAEASCFRITTALNPSLEPKQVPKTAAFLKEAAREGDEAAGVLKIYWQRARPFVVSDKVQRLGDIDPETIKKKQQEQKDKEKEGHRNGDESKSPSSATDGAPATGRDGSPTSAASSDLPDATMSLPSSGPADDKLSPEEKEKKKLADQKHQLEYSSYPSGHSTYGTLCAIFLAEIVPEKQAQLFKRAEEYRQSRLIVGAHFPTDVEAGRIVATAAAALMSQNFAFQRDLAAARTELRVALGLPAEMPSREKEASKAQPVIH